MLHAARDDGKSPPVRSYGATLGPGSEAPRARVERHPYGPSPTFTRTQRPSLQRASTSTHEAQVVVNQARSPRSSSPSCPSRLTGHPLVQSHPGPSGEHPMRPSSSTARSLSLPSQTRRGVQAVRTKKARRKGILTPFYLWVRDHRLVARDHRSVALTQRSVALAQRSVALDQRSVSLLTAQWPSLMA